MLNRTGRRGGCTVMMADVTKHRLALHAAGFAPIPVAGKRALMEGWSTTHASPEEITSWEPRFPQWPNTGILTEDTPALDNDITQADAADAVDELVRDWFDGRGVILTRFGHAPKRAILFQTNSRSQRSSRSLAPLTARPTGWKCWAPGSKSS